ncbi:metallopeptidase family protein [Methylopila musalis]|uniref:Metallopeptidase family protein n=1 Tax=Methylopila musalis TaxID=1134781 RepID=A0ABW3Z7P4_9HYPH
MTADWGRLAAPDLGEMERLADEAFARLPEEFRALARDVVVRVDDFPTDDVLKELEAESEFDLLGLFTGVGLAQGEAAPRTGQFPNVIHLYRRPILDYWAEHEETLGAIVTHVLVHEIGHHFGLSDDDMEAIEALADAETAPA